MAFNPYDRAALISGLRGAASAQSSPLPLQQSFDDLQQVMQMQQRQMQQPLQFQQQLQNTQQQQHQRFANPAQAQLFAIQQSQIELQLQQIKMANLALQEQILLQHQQQNTQQQQQQQQYRAQSPPFAGYPQLQHQQQQLGHGTRYGERAGRSVSASAALPYNPQAVDAMSAWQPGNSAGVYGATQAAPEFGQQMSPGTRQEVRRGALRDLQQARHQREHSLSPSISSSSTFSPPATGPPASDWQFQRMQYRSATEGERSSSPSSVVTPPAQTDSHKRDLVSYQHRKQDSDASDASIQSLSISEAGSQFSPNRGPALVLSKPGDEYPEEDAEHALSGSEDAVEDPMSPSMNASMRAASLRDGLAAKFDQGQSAAKRRTSSSGRHTLILRSSIADLTAQANGDGSMIIYADSDTSSGTSSPTSDKSEVASFESTASTCATSVPNTSPTSASFDKKASKTEQAETKTGEPSLPSSLANIAHRRAVSSSIALNPTATTFAPGHTKNYPSTLSLTSTGSGSNTPGSSAGRVFTAPPRAGTPGKVASVIRQPKGPADEADMASRNFAGMIRRKAIGALRLASATGARASPVSSPVLSGFPGGAFPQQQPHFIESGLPKLSSPPSAFSSPLAASANGTLNMSDLATRALHRRSQQGGYAALLNNQGLGVTQ